MRRAVLSQREASFATLLKRYRGASHLSQEALAERAGLSREAVSALERGERKHPRADTIDLLVTALGLGEAEHRALLQAAKSAVRSRAPSGQSLPVPSTPILGRAHEVATASAQLVNNGVRLLTLTGPGGVGKTRLALEVGSACSDRFADGVAFVALASLGAPALLADTVAHVVGALEQGDRPSEEVLIEHLRDRNMLLVIDNFEHLVATAPLLADLLSACPRLALLVTSRGMLRVRAERVMHVKPLPLPPESVGASLEEIASAAAVSLFIERARAMQPEFELTPQNAGDVVAICRRLDGLPLAIELAAVQTRVLSPKALLTRLERRLPTLTDAPRDLPARHQTLRSALAWSYDLLHAQEQALFRRMSVFAGAGALSAIEAVCLVADAFTGVSVLADHGLVRPEDLGNVAEPRFGMLETMREYGHALLGEAGEAEAAARAHALYYVELAERAETELLGPLNSEWMVRLEAEIDNIRTALEWTRTHSAPDLRLRLGGALWYFWFMSWRLTEGRHWLSSLLEPAATNVPASDVAGVRARTRAFAVASFLAFNQGDYAEATTLAESGLGLYFSIRGSIEKDDRAAQGYALTLLGLVAGSAGKMERAQAVLEEALELGRASGDTGAVVMALRHLGIVARWQHQYERSETLLRECVVQSRSMSRYREYLLAWGLSNLARTVYLRGQFAAARDMLEETLQSLERSPFAGHTLADSLDWLAATLAAQGDTVSAARLFGAAAAQWRAIGAVRFPLDQAAFEHDLNSVRDQLDPTTFAAAWAEGEAMSGPDAIAAALFDPRATLSR